MASEEEIMPENELARPHHRSKVRRDSKAFSGVAFIASAHFMLYIIVIHYIYVYVAVENICPSQFYLPSLVKCFQKHRERE